MTQLVKYDSKAALDIQAVVSECSMQSIVGLPAMERAFKAASGVAALRSMLTDQIVKEVFMPLQGSQIGFRTDKDSSGGYPPNVVRECLIAGFMFGVWGTNNEMNIIAGNMYVTKNGMNRLVEEFPGVTDIEKIPGVPATGNGGALVPYIVRWKKDGKPYEMRFEAPSEREPIDTRICVRVNNGMGADAILGKAERKAMARVYGRLTGLDTVPEGDASEIIEGEITRPAINGKKATKSSAASVLGKEPEMPSVPKHLNPAVEELLKLDSEAKFQELCNAWASDIDSKEALEAVWKWAVDTGHVVLAKPKQGSLVE